MLVPGNTYEFDTDSFDEFQKVNKFSGFSAVRNGYKDIILENHTEIPVPGFSGMDEDGRSSAAG